MSLPRSPRAVPSLRRTTAALLRSFSSSGSCLVAFRPRARGSRRVDRCATSGSGTTGSEDRRPLRHPRPPA